MSRMLFFVPRMYTEIEFRKLAQVIPDDFESRTQEFWTYVEDKLKGYMGKIQRVYRDEICDGGEKALAYLSNTDHDNFSIVKKLVNSGAVLEPTENALLASESAAWLEAIRQNPFDAISLEMYQETIRERDSYVSKRVQETLLDEETGVLFMKPGRTVNLDEGVRVIKVCRFEPADYLRSWQVQQEQ